MSQIFPFNNNILRRLLSWKQGATNNGQRRTTPPANETTLDSDDSTFRIDEHFRRAAKNRMSMPIINNQHKIRHPTYAQLQRPRPLVPSQSLGHIYLQYGGETKQANLPNELTAIDTIRALFVCAFPNMLTMDYMSQLHVKIYIYNPNCNIFYELVNIDDVKHESVLRLHHSEPVIALTRPSPPIHHQYFHAPMHCQYIAPPQIPPPKPRRMIPIQHNQLHSTPNSIYGIPAQQQVGLPTQSSAHHLRPHQTNQHQQQLMYDSFRN